ncbi:hypothetical protein IV203_011785 [Nitzschia inconspicua]|uniref:Uncharacterized protein n=1 Tax=Nitzschia inconspicua TaxID=303405 RepID=A0A9K3KUA2_9STRA|nr:hypothetical protein IV203_011785 [Nitzschia inconspicua]
MIVVFSTQQVPTMVSPPYSPSSNQRRRFRLWKPYSFTSNVARFIVLISFCLTLTVVTTTIRYGKNNHQQFLLLRRNLRDSSSNSLFSHSRRELAGRHLRFLALGGPSTGGQGLSNALDAYPHQLANARNQNVDNYASSVVLGSASASQYSKEQQIMASLCTQSIVGDSNIYDIITLEYQDLDASALSLLTKRLRERFPRAIILFVKLWSPVDFYYIDVEGKEVSFAEWRIQQPSSLEWDDKSAMIRAMQEQRWHLREQLEIGVELEKIFGAVNGMIYQLPTPLNINDNLNVLVEWFEESNSKSSRSDSSITPIHYTLSSNAHTKVYTDLEKIVQKELKRSYEDSATGISPSNTPLVGTWGSGDRCNLWYETGKELSEQHYSRGLQHKEFSHHHALEVVASSGGTLQVQNPFDEDRVVYLTYMTTSANASSKKVYPRTKVRRR